MKVFCTVIFGAALALGGGSAFAQEASTGASAPATHPPESSTSTDHAAHTGAAQQSGAAAPAGAAATAYSDAELRQFADAAIEVQKIQQDQSVAQADKQAKMAAAVQQSGLGTERFNQIAEASRADAQLMQRIQAAATAPQAPAPAGR
ncbi:MAG TPA: DUF4168 domain-containing protein [Sphingobium sp.]|nr:DUF4168 domain-containing protein [Sphingobium sp.]